MPQNEYANELIQIYIIYVAYIEPRIHTPKYFG